MLPTALSLSYREHVRIVQCIREHNPEAASEAMGSHIAAGLGRYLKFTAMEAEAVKERIAPVRKRSSHNSA